MSTPLPRYQPSGLFRPLSLALLLVIPLGGALVAWLYQFLINVIPFIYVNFLLCAGFGAVLGLAVGWAVTTGHCRNPLIAMLFAFPVAAVSLGATYYWDYRHLVTAVQELSPGASDETRSLEISFSQYLEAKQEAGWKLRSSTINGFAVKVIWGLEALVIVGIVLAFAWATAGSPYCERCGRWTAQRALRIPGVGKAQAEALLAAGDVPAVIALQPLPAADHSIQLLLTGSLCTGCKETGFLTVEEKRQTKDKKGKVEEASSQLVEHVILNPGQRAALEARLAGPPAA